MVKFRIGLTVSAETLFGMLAKFLPVEDMQVEELAPKQPTVPKMSKVAALVGRVEKPKRKRKPSKPMDLQAGINGIITAILADGKPHRAVELKPLLQRRGFSPNSIGSRLQSLQEHGIVDKLGDGTWRLVPTTDERQSA